MIIIKTKIMEIRNIIRAKVRLNQDFLVELLNKP